jgi:exonuclease III
MSIITLNVNGINTSTKGQRLLEWIFKKDSLYAIQKKVTKVMEKDTPYSQNPERPHKYQSRLFFGNTGV